MKKLEKLLLIVLILLLFYLTKDINMLPLCISFSMYILFHSIFSTTNITKVLEDSHVKKYYYSRDKIFKYSIVFITLIGILLTVISYFIGNIININNLATINIFMSLSLLVNILLKIINEYLNIVGYKKISNNLININNIITLIISIILSILLYKVFKLDNYINIILLYSISIVVFIIITILLYILVFRKRRKYNKKKEENKINYISIIKNVVVGNQIETIFNVIKSAYIYTSIIILYYVLTNKYNYNHETVGILITNTYFYSLIIIYIIYKKISNYITIDYSNIKDTFNSSINKIIKISLNMCILLVIISIPINNILFNNDYNYLSGLIPLLFFYILYNFIININIKYSKNKSTMITLLIGLIIKIIFELPLINTIYRMGYSLLLGSILSIVLGMMITIVIGIIFIKNRFKINLLDNFNNILNIIYESIIYTLILVLFTLIVKPDTSSIIGSVSVIIFYLFITSLFYIIKRLITKK